MKTSHGEEKFVLAFVGQMLFAGIGEDHSWGGGLHVLNAGVILVLAFWCLSWDDGLDP